jgi:hypothetical protein
MIVSESRFPSSDPSEGTLFGIMGTLFGIMGTLFGIMG